MGRRNLIRVVDNLEAYYPDIYDAEFEDNKCYIDIVEIVETTIRCTFPIFTTDYLEDKKSIYHTIYDWIDETWKP